MGGLATRSRKARELRIETEHRLMQITGAGGFHAAERAIAALNGATGISSSSRGVPHCGRGARSLRAGGGASQKVGARKTARMLESALAPHTTPTQLSALTDRFYDVPEDLALLTARRVGLRL